MTLPVVALTSVVRGAQQGDGHGGFYVVDLELQEVRQELDWSDPDIDFSGDGGDRGLRGIAILGDRVFVASSRAIHEFTPSMEHVGTWSCPYLLQAHEIALRQGHLLVVSTAFDSLLALNLTSMVFTWGLCVRRVRGEVNASEFDPRRAEGPAKGDTLHLNSVAVTPDEVWLTGTRLESMLRITDDGLELSGTLPPGTHNVLPYRGGRIFNDTARDRLVVEAGEGLMTMDVPRYPVSALTQVDARHGPLARQGFARGLCLDGDVAVGGSSPTTITAWDLRDLAQIRSIQVSTDVRNAVHGIALWPFD